LPWWFPNPPLNLRQSDLFLNLRPPLRLAFALPRRDGRLHSHQRHGVLHHRYRFRIPLDRQIPRKWLPKDAQGLASIVEEDLRNLRLGKVGPTYGDLRCIILGHLTRLAIWNLRKEWCWEADTEKKLLTVNGWMEHFGGLSAVEEHLDLTSSGIPRIRFAGIQEGGTTE
jgi:hypothetical protein